MKSEIFRRLQNWVTGAPEALENRSEVEQDDVPDIPPVAEMAALQVLQSDKPTTARQAAESVDPVFEPLPLPERAEVPTDLLVVVFDDMPNARADTKARVGLNIEGAGKTFRIETPANILDALNTALRGKSSGQADVVLLDHRYYDNLKSWLPDPAQLARLAETTGVEFEAFIPTEIIRWDGSKYFEDNGAGQLYYPSSISNSLLLRALGYQGKIFVVSSDPPEPAAYLQYVEKLRAAVPSFPAGLPLNGMIHKGKHTEQLFYATEVDENDRWVVEVSRGDQEVVFRRLVGVPFQAD